MAAGVVDRVINAPDSIRINQSRCSRMRLNRNSCSDCIGACPEGAIELNRGIKILEERCSGCMQCVAACRNGCFEIDTDGFYSVIAKSKEIRSPVLGCNKRDDVRAHAKTPCLGFLSEEHLIALSVFMKEPLQINLAGCSDCNNGFIVKGLKDRLGLAMEKTSLVINEKIGLIEDKKDLYFRDVSYDRRGFFKTIRNIAVSRTAYIFEDNGSYDKAFSYSSKKLPFKRELLNRILENAADDIKKRIIENYYYDVCVTESCNNCFACVGMCPTGALKTDKDGLFFSSSLCNGCGLCEDFCLNRSLRIKQGVPARDPFDFIGIRNAPCNDKHS